MNENLCNIDDVAKNYYIWLVETGPKILIESVMRPINIALQQANTECAKYLLEQGSKCDYADALSYDNPEFIETYLYRIKKITKSEIAFLLECAIKNVIINSFDKIKDFIMTSAQNPSTEHSILQEIQNNPITAPFIRANLADTLGVIQESISIKSLSKKFTRDLATEVVPFMPEDQQVHFKQKAQDLQVILDDFHCLVTDSPISDSVAGYIENNSYNRGLYDSLLREISAHYMAASVVYTGWVDHDVSGRLGFAGDMMGYLSEMSCGVFGILGSICKFVDHNQQSFQISQLGKIVIDAVELRQLSDLLFLKIIRGIEDGTLDLEERSASFTNKIEGFIEGVKDLKTDDIKSVFGKIKKLLSGYKNIDNQPLIPENIEYETAEAVGKITAHRIIFSICHSKVNIQKRSIEEKAVILYQLTLEPNAFLDSKKFHQLLKQTDAAISDESNLSSQKEEGEDPYVRRSELKEILERGDARHAEYAVKHEEFKAQMREISERGDARHAEYAAKQAEYAVKHEEFQRQYLENQSKIIALDRKLNQILEKQNQGFFTKLGLCWKSMFHTHHHKDPSNLQDVTSDENTNENVVLLIGES